MSDEDYFMIIISQWMEIVVMVFIIEWRFVVLLFPIVWEPLCCCFQLHGNHHVVVSNYMRTIVLLFPNARKPLCCCFQFHENLCIVASNCMKIIVLFQITSIVLLFPIEWKQLGLPAFLYGGLCVFLKRKETIVLVFISWWRPM